MRTTPSFRRNPAQASCSRIQAGAGGGGAPDATANDLVELGIVEKKIAEPDFADADARRSFMEKLGHSLHRELKALSRLDADRLLAERTEKYRKIGRYDAYSVAGTGTAPAPHTHRWFPMGNDAPRRLLDHQREPAPCRQHHASATNAFVAGMQAGGAYDCETVHLCALKITPCTGCLSCWGAHGGRVRHPGRRYPALKQKIPDADVILCSFPLYYFGMPGQMKVALDRLLSLVYAYHGQNAPTDGSPAHEFRYPMVTQAVAADIRLCLQRDRCGV